MVVVQRAGSARRVVMLTAGFATAALVGGGVAIAATQAGPAIQTRTPRTERDVTNVDVDKQQVKNYYGDPMGTGTFGADSNYVKEVRAVEAEADRYLSRPHRARGTKAIVLDVDDTALNTWAFELSINFAFTSAAQQPWVDGQKFVAEPGMVDLVKKAEREGYAIFFLTGRGAAQEKATLGNLTADGVGVDAGYPKPTALSNGEDGLFTKPAVADYPDYLKAACASDPNGSCTTVHYKMATRKHIESLGYDIVANFGDQYSDLTGGYADRTVKLPNPSYFLP